VLLDTPETVQIEPEVPKKKPDRSGNVTEFRWGFAFFAQASGTMFEFPIALVFYLFFVFSLTFGSALRTWSSRLNSQIFVIIIMDGDAIAVNYYLTSPRTNDMRSNVVGLSKREPRM
jgi:hypothetical protein